MIEIQIKSEDESYLVVSLSDYADSALDGYGSGQIESMEGMQRNIVKVLVRLLSNLYERRLITEEDLFDMLGGKPFGKEVSVYRR